MMLPKTDHRGLLNQHYISSSSFIHISPQTLAAKRDAAVHQDDSYELALSCFLQQSLCKLIQSHFLFY
jgi:hypothetical protein